MYQPLDSSTSFTIVFPSLFFFLFLFTFIFVFPSFLFSCLSFFLSFLFVFCSSLHKLFIFHFLFLFFLYWLTFSSTASVIIQCLTSSSKSFHIPFCFLPKKKKKKRQVTVHQINICCVARRNDTFFLSKIYTSLFLSKRVKASVV